MPRLDSALVALPPDVRPQTLAERVEYAREARAEALADIMSSVPNGAPVYVRKRRTSQDIDGNGGE